MLSHVKIVFDLFLQYSDCGALSYDSDTSWGNPPVENSLRHKCNNFKNTQGTKLTLYEGFIVLDAIQCQAKTSTEFGGQENRIAMHLNFDFTCQAYPPIASVDNTSKTRQ